MTKAPSQSIPGHRGRRGYPMSPSRRVCESRRPPARQQAHHPPAPSVSSSGSKPTSITGIASRSPTPKTAVINLRPSLAGPYGPPLVRGPDRLISLVRAIPHRGSQRPDSARLRTRQQRWSRGASRECTAARILLRSGIRNPHAIRGCTSRIYANPLAEKRAMCNDRKQ